MLRIFNDKFWWNPKHVQYYIWKILIMKWYRHVGPFRSHISGIRLYEMLMMQKKKKSKIIWLQPQTQRPTYLVIESDSKYVDD